MDTVKIVLMTLLLLALLLLARQGRDTITQLDTIGTELQQVNVQLDLVRRQLPPPRPSP